MKRAIAGMGVLLAISYSGCRENRDPPKPAIRAHQQPAEQQHDDDFIGEPKDEFERRVVALHQCIGLTVKQIETAVPSLQSAKHYMIEEPPLVLRGITFYTEVMDVSLDIDENEPMYRSTRREDWTREKVSACVVSGIQIFGFRGRQFDIGPGVPFQFRR